MRQRAVRTIGVPIAVLATLIAAGCAAAAPVAPSAPATRFAPYVDVITSGGQLAAMADATGVKDAVLSFATSAGGRCEPAWGGVRPITDPAVRQATSDFAARGGTITVATGGARGPYLENSCDTADELAAAYGAVLDATGAERLDVDIEAKVPDDTVVTALRRLQDQRGTDVSLTLPVADQDEGLDDDAMELVRLADEAGVRFTVNAMVMNFEPRGDWGRAMVDAVDATGTHLHEVWPAASDREIAARMGVTFMIGRNDQGMLTTIEDARTVAADAGAKGIADVGLWAVGRDNGGCPGRAAAAFDCSGIAQAPFAFTETVRDAVATGCHDRDRGLGGSRGVGDGPRVERDGPIFVDGTGRRARLARKAAYARHVDVCGVHRGRRGQPGRRPAHPDAPAARPRRERVRARTGGRRGAGEPVTGTAPTAVAVDGAPRRARRRARAAHAEAGAEARRRSEARTRRAGAGAPAPVRSAARRRPRAPAPAAPAPAPVPVPDRSPVGRKAASTIRPRVLRRALARPPVPRPGRPGHGQPMSRHLKVPPPGAGSPG